MRFALGLVLAAATLSAAPAKAEAVKWRFGAAKTGSAAPAEALGGYAAGCLAGGEALPITGPGWQAMRLERRRNWGHPEMLAYIERLGASAQALGWPGILVGDISQPRGGPMTSGHRSHQIGIDADIWMRPAPERELSWAERSEIGSYTVTNADDTGMSHFWTPTHAQILRAAASDPAVARIFVNAAIKRQLCQTETGDRAWLRKIRPWWGHDAHFHVRLSCPAGSAACFDQAPPPAGDGCDASLDWWFSEEARNPKPKPGDKPKRRKELALADLPAACVGVLAD